MIRLPEIAHERRRVFEVPRRRGLVFVVVECSCGWTSALHGSEIAAGREHERHAAEARAATR